MPLVVDASLHFSVPQGTHTLRAVRAIVTAWGALPQQVIDLEYSTAFDSFRGVGVGVESERIAHKRHRNQGRQDSPRINFTPRLQALELLKH